MSFRVISTLDVDDESEIPVDFSGRVRRSFNGAESYVAWFTEGVLDNPGRNHPAYRRFRADGQVKYEMYYEQGQAAGPDRTGAGGSRLLRQRPVALRGALPRRQAQRRGQRRSGSLEVAGGWHLAAPTSLPQRQADHRQARLGQLTADLSDHRFGESGAVTKNHVCNRRRTGNMLRWHTAGWSSTSRTRAGS